MKRPLRRLILWAALVAVLAVLLVPAGLALAQQSATYRLGCFSLTAGAGPDRTSTNYRTRDLTSWVNGEAGGSSSASYRLQPGAVQSRLQAVPPPGPGPVAPAPDLNGFKLPIIFRGELRLVYWCN